jgi:hypothetical protein
MGAMVLTLGSRAEDLQYAQQAVERYPRLKYQKASTGLLFVTT